MKFENDFAKEEIVDLNIKDREGFRYKPTNAGEELEWLPEYNYIDKEGNSKQDFVMLNKCKMQNIISVPYTPDLLKKILTGTKLVEGEDVNIYEWKNLNMEQRWDILKKLKGKTFDLILHAIDNIDNPKSNQKKT